MINKAKLLVCSESEKLDKRTPSVGKYLQGGFLLFRDEKQWLKTVEGVTDRCVNFAKNSGCELRLRLNNVFWGGKDLFDRYIHFYSYKRTKTKPE